MMSLWAMQMIYVDDLHLVAAGPQKYLVIWMMIAALEAVGTPFAVAAGPQKYLVIWMMIAALEAVGTPFAYHKFRGGLRIDFIGYHLSYDCWAAGLSQKRCEWVTDWIDRAEANGWMVLGRHFIELVGRLTFVGQAGEAEGEAALEVAVEDDEEQQQDASACPYWVSVSRRSQFRRLHAKDKCGVLPWTVFRACPYWVSVSRRSQFRRLHAKDKCGVLPWTVFRAEGFQTVDEANADAWCKICWRKISHDGAEAS
eukprot:s13841_g2.t1